MKHYLFVSSAVVAVLAGTLATPARANECDKLTYVTFSGPVALPGVALPAGTYQFTHPDCEMATHVLRVASQDGTKTYGTFLTIPDHRAMPDRRTEVLFAEMSPGAPEAITAWFYSGETSGDRLIYPRHEAAQVAKAPVQRHS